MGRGQALLTAHGYWLCVEDDHMSFLSDELTERLKSFTPESQDGDFRCLECKRTEPVKGLNIAAMCRENRWPKCCDSPMTLSCATPADQPKRGAE